MKPFGELFKASWDLYKKKINVLAVLFAIPFAINVLSYLVNRHHVVASNNVSINPYAAAGVGGLALLFALAAVVISLYVQVASVFAVDDPDNHPGVGELLSKSGSLILPFLWVGILTALAIFGGLILLIIPGIIFAVWFSFVTFTVVLEKKKGTEAMKASKELVTGRFGAVFGRFLLFGLCIIGIEIVAGIVLAILHYTLVRQIGAAALSNFLVTPLALIFAYLLYKDLKSAAPATAAPAAPAPSEPAQTPPAQPAA